MFDVFRVYFQLQSIFQNDQIQPLRSLEIHLQNLGFKHDPISSLKLLYLQWMECVIILLMQIRQIYEVYHPQGILGGSYAVKFYHDSKVPSKSLVIKNKHKQSFIIELQKKAKKLPGVGQYTIVHSDSNKSKYTARTIDFTAEAKKPHKNYIQEIIRSKKGIPGVGKYQLNFDKFQKQRQRYTVLGDKIKKAIPPLKNTIFAEAPVDCINVGPGSYNPQSSLQALKKSFRLPIKQQKDKTHKKSHSLPKLPTPQTYHPIAPSYNTFDKIQSQRKTQEEDYAGNKKSSLDRQKRFSQVKNIGPGPKYSLIADWSPKPSKNPLKVQNNIFKSTKSMIPPSIYH